MLFVEFLKFLNIIFTKHINIVAERFNNCTKQITDDKQYLKNFIGPTRAFIKLWNPGKKYISANGAIIMNFILKNATKNIKFKQVY